MNQMQDFASDVRWYYVVPGNTERIVISQRQDGICKGDEPEGRGMYSVWREVLFFGQWRTVIEEKPRCGYTAFSEVYFVAEQAWHEAANRLAIAERLAIAARVDPTASMDEDVGFSSYADGCNVCAPNFVDGKPVYQRIEPRGKYMCCVKCGGSYGEVPQLEMQA